MPLLKNFISSPKEDNPSSGFVLRLSEEILTKQSKKYFSLESLAGASAPSALDVLNSH